MHACDHFINEIDNFKPGARQPVAGAHLVS